MPRFGRFGLKNYWLSNLNKISHALFWMFWLQICHFFLENLSQNPQIWVFGPKSINFLIFTKFFMSPISKVLISNVTFGFRKFLAQMPKFEHFGLKSINFLVLTKFRIYPISKMQISNLILVFENVSPNAQIWAFWTKTYQLSNVNEILYVSYFEGADFKSYFRIRKFCNFITSLIKINYFIFWFYLLNQTQDWHALIIST